ncbi:MAG: IS3 family transposase [Pirellulaceae bacterium]|nr:IS3 family transposase [Pirellulaceae bacterium]
MSGKRRKFTKEFKSEIVNLVRNGGRSVPDVAREYDLVETCVYSWVKQARVDSGNGPAGALMSQEKEELSRLRKENRELRRERDFLSPSDGILREGKTMKFRFINAWTGSFPVAWMCRRLGVSRAGYYAWNERPESARTQRDRHLALKVRAFHKASDGVYGSPRIYRDLSGEGEKVSRKRVARLMRENGLSGEPPKRRQRTTDSAHKLPIAENIVARNFNPKTPNQIWASDITYVRTWQGWLFVAVVLDLFSRRVVGWAAAEHMRTELVTDALRMAINERRPGQGLVHHSDRGSQYASGPYQKLLHDHGMTCSMSRKGDCWDNGVVESFFATLKKELIYRNSWPSRLRASTAIDEYIDRFYNSRRRHSTLGFVSPMEYELRASSMRLAA